MVVTLEEMKNYLRVDYEDDDALLAGLISAAQRLCMDVARTEDEAVLRQRKMPVCGHVRRGLSI